MKFVPIGQFKTHFLTLLRDVEQNHETLIVTRYGKPVAQVLPFTPNEESEKNPLKGSIVFEKDITIPIGDTWKSGL